MWTIVRFEVITAVMKFYVIWDVVLCQLVNSSQQLGAFSLHLQGLNNCEDPEDECGKAFLNISNY